jgi:hypothetical protein
MALCISFGEFLDISRPQIEEFRVLSERYAGQDTNEACEAFTRQVNIVEGLMRHAYGMSSKLARKSADLKEVSDIWSAMSALCNSALTVLTSLKDKYPYCGTAELYDFVLDLKLAADKRHDNVEEEIACQKIQMPDKLFPGTI